MFFHACIFYSHAQRLVPCPLSFCSTFATSGSSTERGAHAVRASVEELGHELLDGEQREGRERERALRVAVRLQLDDAPAVATRISPPYASSVMPFHRLSSLQL